MGGAARHTGLTHFLYTKYHKQNHAFWYLLVCKHHSFYFQNECKHAVKSSYWILNLNFLFETFWVEQELIAVRPGSGRTGSTPGLHRAVLSPLLAQTAFKTHWGVEKGRDNLSGLIPLSSVWTWEWSYRFQSRSELRSFEFWLLCAWKSGFYPDILFHVTDMMLFEIEKINALQTSFA